MNQSQRFRRGIEAGVGTGTYAGVLSVLSTCTGLVSDPGGSVVLQVETPRNFDFGSCFRSFNRQDDL